MQAWRKLMAAYRRAYDSRHLTYRLTAKNRDQLQNPTLANRLWATFTFFIQSIRPGVCVVRKIAFGTKWLLS